MKRASYTLVFSVFAAGCSNSRSALETGPHPSGVPVDAGLVAPPLPTEDAGPTAPCPSTQLLCDDRCVDPDTDNRYCGALNTCRGRDRGVICPAGHTCDGTGRCRLSCQDGLLTCDGICTDPRTSQDHCGATDTCTGDEVGVVCAPSTVCNGNGRCEPYCEAGSISCDERCVQPQTDRRYCGASGDCRGASAGISCERAEDCVDGACTGDSDRDGLSNVLETLTGTDPTDADSDDDGLLDGDEDINGNGAIDPGETSPLNPDSDGDGLCDRHRQDNEDDGIAPADACTDSEVIFVHEAGPAVGDGDGTTWERAFSLPSLAAAAARAGQEIWIGAGVYPPADMNAPTLTLKTGVNVRGGFRGDEVAFNQRSDDRALVVLTGDVDSNDDAAEVSSFLDNAAHVLLAPDDTVAVRVDVLTARAGNAAGPGAARDGGGLRAVRANLELVNVEFVSNAAAGDGGAVYLEDSVARLTDVTFRANTANNAGGGLMLAGGSLTLERALLRQNRANQEGGALFLVSPMAPVITEAVFHANEAEFGGAVFSVDVAPVFSDVQFESNRAAYGGALCSQDAQADVAHANFHGNVATAAGGAIYEIGGGSSMRDAVFSENTAAGSGGAVFSAETSVDLSHVQFFNNASEFHGGAIAVVDGDPSITDSTFTNNESAADGGAFYGDDANATLTDLQFSENSAEGSGGALFTRGASGLLLTRTRFVSNEAASSGGGMMILESSPTLTDVAFLFNSALAGGGLYNAKGSATLLNTHFLGNSTRYSGGGMFIQGGDPILLDVSFALNSGTSGGALYNGNAGTVVTRAAFLGNFGGPGGAVYNQESAAVFRDTTFTGNTAPAGGAVYNDSSSPLFVNASFYANSATNSGGAVFNFTAQDQESSPAFINVSFQKNTAGRGGAVANASALPRVVLQNVATWGNTATQADPDINNLSNTAVTNSCVEQDSVAALSPNNVDIADPAWFAPSRVSGEPYLDPASACAAVGDDAVATTAGLNWDTQTTSTEGTLDESPVDAGRHYNPEQVAILSLVTSSDTVTWETLHATTCVLRNDLNAVEVLLDGPSAESGAVAHDLATDTAVVLFCSGPGSPALAFGAVP